MPWPPADHPWPANKSNATVQQDDHAPTHNSEQLGLNDIVDRLLALEQRFDDTTGAPDVRVIADTGGFVELHTDAGVRSEDQSGAFVSYLNGFAQLSVDNPATDVGFTSGNFAFRSPSALQYHRDAPVAAYFDVSWYTIVEITAGITVDVTLQYTLDDPAGTPTWLDVPGVTKQRFYEVAGITQRQHANGRWIVRPSDVASVAPADTDFWLGVYMEIAATSGPTSFGIWNGSQSMANFAVLE